MRLINLVRFASISILSLTVLASCEIPQDSQVNGEGTNLSSSQNAKLKFNTTENGIAIKGADPVAYFKEGKAIEGSKEFSYEWGNATWLFDSAEHRDLFAANPEAYAPQYGGYCAWAVSQNTKETVDPKVWKIVDGKLYLNYNKSVQRTWSRDISGNIAQADAYWPRLSKR